VRAVPVWAILCAVLALCALVSCTKEEGRVAGQATAPPVTTKVLVAKKEPLTPELRSFGSISYRSKADIATTVDGTVQSLAVEEGDHVGAGQLLARLENVQLAIRRSQAESQVLAAKAAVELARARLWEGKQQVEARLLSLKKTQLSLEQKKRERDDLRVTLDNREKLFRVDGISEEQLQSLRLQYASAETACEALLTDLAINSIGLRDQDMRAAGMAVPAGETERVALLASINTQTLQAQLDSAQAGLQTAVSDLQAARALAEELSITSPVAGIIGVRHSGVGERLRTGDKLFTIIDDAQVYAVFLVAENRSVGLSEGMPVQVEVPALGNRLLRSTITIVSPLLDPQSGNLTVRALLPNEGGGLKPGLFIRVKVRTGDTRQALLLPSTAIVGRNGRDGSVYIVRDGRCFRRAVVLGLDSEGQVPGKLEVESGIVAGDLVVDEPSPVLQDGGEVNARP
jgi:RND family efflux transporter MFP subunit